MKYSVSQKQSQCLKQIIILTIQSLYPIAIVTLNPSHSLWFSRLIPLLLLTSIYLNARQVLHSSRGPLASQAMRRPNSKRSTFYTTRGILFARVNFKWTQRLLILATRNGSLTGQRMRWSRLNSTALSPARNTSLHSTRKTTTGAKVTLQILSPVLLNHWLDLLVHYSISSV